MDTLTPTRFSYEHVTVESRQLSGNQVRILTFLEDYIRSHGYAPSIRDIQLGTNISSTSVVDYNLKALTRYGFIDRRHEISRGIVLKVRHGYCPTCGQPTSKNV